MSPDKVESYESYLLRLKKHLTQCHETHVENMTKSLARMAELRKIDAMMEQQNREFSRLQERISKLQDRSPGNHLNGA